jgi:hypothetical protein
MTYFAMLRRITLAASLGLLLTGCAASPDRRTAVIPSSLTPEQVAAGLPAEQFQPVAYEPGPNADQQIERASNSRPLTSYRASHSGSC